MTSLKMGRSPKEYCRYIRTYSELEGLQHAYTLIYCAASVPQGVLMELRREQQGRLQWDAVLLPQGSFPRAMQLARYLCENGVGLGQWRDVLADAGQPYYTLENEQAGELFPEYTGKSPAFCAMC